MTCTGVSSCIKVMVFRNCFSQKGWHKIILHHFQTTISRCDAHFTITGFAHFLEEIRTNNYWSSKPIPHSESRYMDECLNVCMRIFSCQQPTVMFIKESMREMGLICPKMLTIKSGSSSIFCKVHSTNSLAFEYRLILTPVKIAFYMLLILRPHIRLVIRLYNVILFFLKPLAHSIQC